MFHFLYMINALIFFAMISAIKSVKKNQPHQKDIDKKTQPLLLDG